MLAAPLTCAPVRREAILNLARGFLMGTADAVPGVSGGTIALLVGIYERLVHAVSEAARALGAGVRGRFGEARGHIAGIDWLLIIPLLVGILVAIVSLARLVEYLLEERPQDMAGVFFGLVAASAWVAWTLIRRPAAQHAVIAVVVGMGAFFLLSLSASDVTDPPLWAIFGAGAIAVCAMILPGISGSFVLLMLGMYEFIISAVNDRDLGTLLVFAVGAVIGLAVFSTVLDRALRRFHDLIMAGLVGLMLGSLRVLWPWPDGVDSADLGAPPADDWVLPVVLAIVSAAFVVGLTLLARRSPGKEGKGSVSLGRRA